MNNCLCGLHWGHTGKHRPHFQCNKCIGTGQIMQNETTDDLELVDCADCLGTGVEQDDTDMSGANDELGYANDR